MSRYKFSQVEKIAIWEAHDKKCIYCKEPISFTNLHIDHILPENLLQKENDLSNIRAEYSLSPKFGINTYYNWVPAHSACNLTKSNRIFAKNRAIFFLEIAESKYEKVLEIEKKLEKRKQDEKILVLLSLAIDQGDLTVTDVNAIINQFDDLNNRFKILQKLEFLGRTIIDYVEKDNIEKILDLPLKLGSPDITHLDLIDSSGNKVYVRTCREWNKALNNGYYPLTNFDIKMSAFFVRTCGLINALAMAKVADNSYFGNVGVVDLELLPVSIFPYLSSDDKLGVEAALVKGECEQDWVNLKKISIKSVTKYSVRLEENNGMGIILWELMRADFNNDGFEELLVYGYNYATQGTLGFGEIIMLGRKSDSSKFVVLEQ